MPADGSHPSVAPLGSGSEFDVGALVGAQIAATGDGHREDRRGAACTPR
jgi:hypothetical protein